MLFDDWTFSFFGSDGNGQYSSAPELRAKKAAQVSCGVDHSAVLFNDGTFSFFGLDSHGQCRTGQRTD